MIQVAIDLRVFKTQLRGMAVLLGPRQEPSARTAGGIIELDQGRTCATRRAAGGGCGLHLSGGVLSVAIDAPDALLRNDRVRALTLSVFGMVWTNIDACSERRGAVEVIAYLVDETVHRDVGADAGGRAYPEVDSIDYPRKEDAWPAPRGTLGLRALYEDWRRTH